MAYVLDQSGNWYDDGTGSQDPQGPGGVLNNPAMGTPSGTGPDTTPIDPRTGLPVVGGGIDPWGQSPDNPDYGYPPGQGPNENYGQPTPGSTPSGGGGSSSGGGPPTGRPSGGLMDWGPQFNAPVWNAPAPFSYKDFTAPTLEEAQNAPGYQFGLQQGQQALSNSQAAQGVYRTGGSLKDLFNYTNQAATQNYGNVFNQDAQVYTTNRNNAAQNYMTNYTGSKDAFDRTYQSALDTFRPQEAYALGDFARQWDIYQAQLDAQKTLINAGA